MGHWANAPFKGGSGGEQVRTPDMDEEEEIEPV